MKKTRTIFGVLAVHALAVGIVAYAWHSRSGGEAQSPTLRDNINSKLVQNGIPTIPADATNIFVRPLDPTLVAASDATRAMAPTIPPRVAACGPGGVKQQMYDQYGDGGCVKIDTGWMFISQGHKQSGLTGVIAIFDCAAGDDACNAGREPSVGAWKIYPPRVSGAIKVLGRRGPDVLILDIAAGEYCFNIVTRVYDATPTCQ